MQTPERVPQPSAVPIALETVGDRITKARKIAGLRTILALHKKCLINRNSLGQYEWDEVNPSKAMVNSIALACRVSPEWLATGYGHPFDGTDRASDLRVSDSLWGLADAEIIPLPTAV